MGIYGTLEYERLGDLCAEACTDESAGRRIIVSEEPLSILDGDGRKQVHPELGHVSITLRVDGYQSVGMFLPARVIDDGGEVLTKHMDQLAMRAKVKGHRNAGKPFAGETVRERFIRLGEGKPGGYGTAGGSAGDHIIALREAIERGDGDKVYPT